MVCACSNVPANFALDPPSPPPPGGKCEATESWDGRHRSTTWELSKHQLIKIVSLLAEFIDMCLSAAGSRQPRSSLFSSAPLPTTPHHDPEQLSKQPGKTCPTLSKTMPLTHSPPPSSDPLKNNQPFCHPHSQLGPSPPSALPMPTSATHTDRPHFRIVAQEKRTKPAK